MILLERILNLRVMDISVAHREIQDLRKIKTDLEISQNLGISLQNLDGFLKRKTNCSRIIYNLPIYLREINNSTKIPFSSHEIKAFWKFIDSITHHLSEKISPITILMQITISQKYLFSEIKQFFIIFQWLIRKLAIKIYGRWSFKINHSKAATLIFKGKGAYHRLYFRSSLHNGKKSYLERLLPMLQFKKAFLIFPRPHQDHIPFYLWQTRAFPELKFASVYAIRRLIKN